MAATNSLPSSINSKRSRPFLETAVPLWDVLRASHACRPLQSRHLCLAVYTLAGRNILRGLMVQTIADRRGIDFALAEEMAIAAEKAGLVRHQVHTVSLTAAGHDRGATLTAAAVKRPARRGPIGDVRSRPSRKSVVGVKNSPPRQAREPHLGRTNRS